MLVKDGIVVYDHNVELKADAAYGNGFIDTTTRLDNASVVSIDTPQPFFGGWYAYNGSIITLTTNGLNNYKERLINQMKAIADKYEYATILVNSKPVKTDFVSQQYISGMYNTVQLNPAKVINYVYADGTWDTLDKTAVETLSSAVSDHVENCFDRRKDLQFAIMACNNLTEIQAAEADLNNGWPTIVEDQS